MKDKANITPAALSALGHGNLANFFTAATPGGIEAQEKRGQQGVTRSETLPKEMRPEDRRVLESIGFVFGKDEDDLFIKVVMPTGWSKRPTDHSMWSDLIDDKGRKRGRLFYKATFYDRTPHSELCRRYRVNRAYVESYGRTEPVRFFVADHDGTVLFEAYPVMSGDWGGEDQRRKECCAWLYDHFPNWQDPGAYWV